MTGKENVLTRTLSGKAQQGPAIWIEGRFLYYRSSLLAAPEMKERAGARWDGKQQCWRIPKLTREARFLLEYDPDAKPTQDVKRLAKGEWEKTDEQVMGAFDYDPAFQRPLDHLYPFQRMAVAAAVTRPYHGCGLILSPGLGKTPTSIIAAEMWAQRYGESGRILVVTPLPLMMNWYREITGTQVRNQFQWSIDPRVELLHGEAPTPTKDVVWSIANVDTVMERAKNSNNQWIATGNLNPDFDLDWDVVILEESVLYKNRKAKRSAVMKTLASISRKVFELSGAPTTKDNSDAWQQLNIMEPDYLTAFWKFARESCIVIETPWSKGEIIGSRKDYSIRDEYPELLFVRNQEEVFDELPEYIYKDVELPLTRKQQKAHDDIMVAWLHELEENPSKRVEVTAVIAMLTRLQQVTSNLYNLETTGHVWPDESTKADFVEKYLASDEYTPEYPCLIWAHHRPGMQALYNRLQKHASGKGPLKKQSPLFGKRIEMVRGGTKNADQIIEDYKDGKVDVLILGITVGKYGHTLAISKTIIVYDKTWDSDAWFQMLHRAAGARALLAGYYHRPLFLTLRCRQTVDDFVELNLAGKLPGMAQMTGANLAKILRSLGEDHAPGY